MLALYIIGYLLWGSFVCGILMAKMAPDEVDVDSVAVLFLGCFLFWPIVLFALFGFGIAHLVSSKINTRVELKEKKRIELQNQQEQEALELEALEQELKNGNSSSRTL